MLTRTLDKYCIKLKTYLYVDKNTRHVQYCCLLFSGITSNLSQAIYEHTTVTRGTRGSIFPVFLMTRESEVTSTHGWA